MEEDELTPEEEQEPTDQELEQIAFENLHRAIEDVVSFMGADQTSLLTDWVVVAIDQRYDDEGRLETSPAIIIPRHAAEHPPYRIKGLLVDALDGLRNDETTTYIVVNTNKDGDDDGDDD